MRTCVENNRGLEKPIYTSNYRYISAKEQMKEKRLGIRKLVLYRMPEEEFNHSRDNFIESVGELFRFPEDDDY